MLHLDKESKNRDLIFLTDYNCFGKFTNSHTFIAVFKEFHQSSGILRRSLYNVLHQLFCSSLEDYSLFLSSLVAFKNSKSSFLHEFSKKARQGSDFPSKLKKEGGHEVFLQILGLDSAETQKKVEEITQQPDPITLLNDLVNTYKVSLEHFTQQKIGRSLAYLKHKHGKVFVSSNQVLNPSEKDLGSMVISYDPSKGDFQTLIVSHDEELIGQFFLALIDICGQINMLSLLFVIRHYSDDEINQFIDRQSTEEQPQQEQLREFLKSIPSQYKPTGP